ncbi:iron complex outermembrane receptor protein [Enterovirga rhinocerotis]|uniref:Iron complex outermembrane receptor protein n=1 Tax=Enterovirga rhinocerotis TaxID=1339210 RepID=A0A4V3DYW6_9HYPH|nr:iron complex outermembrane receptor protein [Enterovirga rhinocerotis]
MPTVEQARAEIDRVPGGVALVPDTAFKNGPANTIKDVLGGVPGVIAQMRWGQDARVSIRGSGLSRNYGNRGINFFMDGIPINQSDGLTDLFEIDPTAYRYVEVFRGASALRFGGNSLGGAVNFVWPTGRDAPAFDARIDGGAFGYLKGSASVAGARGPVDWSINGSAQREDGYRAHSGSEALRLNANIGYQLSPDAETRFYLNANSWRARIPGELDKATALRRPRSANPVWVEQDQQRNIDSVRLGSKTTLRFDTTTVDLGLFTHQRRVDHPIYRYLDYTLADYGGFVRATDDRMIGAFRNRFVAGVNLQAGSAAYKESANVGAATKGALLRSETQNSQNHSLYVENSFYVLPTLALIGGGQFLHAVRDRKDRFLSDGDQSVGRTWDLFSPRAGILWDVTPHWQVFGNVSRSAEVPTYDSSTFVTFAGLLPNVRVQTSTTYEIGTRGRTEDLTWDLALYRADLRNELQCLRTSPYNLCSVVNADRTIHQGIEAGIGVAVLKSVFAAEDRFWLNAAYTYNDFRFDRDARWGNNELPGVPQHHLRAELLYKHASGFHIGPSVEWMPKGFYADNANSLKVPAYALLNVRVGFDRGTGWSGYLEARNLTDKRYISTAAIADVATASSELFNPGMGRSVYAGLRYRW